MRVAIVGAGPSGVAAAVELKRIGIEEIVIFEMGKSVGGTWRDNIYPGLTCDVPSHLYRFSFAPNPDWTHEYASGAEICAYIRNVADKFEINPLIRYGIHIKQAKFTEDGKWQLSSERGSEGDFDAVIAATGILRHPFTPSISGSEDFAGISFHSSKWDPKLNLTGRRVGIIGTGSTAVQILPSIIDKVESCALFQRTPQWIFPVPNREISASKRQSFVEAPEKLAALYDHLADRFNNVFGASMVGENDIALEETAAACRANLEQNVHDLELRRRLTPDYAVGCKRLVVSEKFYPAIQKPNAQLVTDSIRRIETSGIRTANEDLYTLDTIIYATGFDPFRFVRPMHVIGCGGLALDEAWATATEAYRSVAIPSFPNFFLIGGPNSPIGNFSFLMTAETQISYIAQLLNMLRSSQYKHIAPTTAATDRFNSEIKAAMPKTVWVTGGCSSWYIDKNGNVVSWPWTYDRFKQELAMPRIEDFELT